MISFLNVTLQSCALTPIMTSSAQQLIKQDEKDEPNTTYKRWWSATWAQVHYAQQRKLSTQVCASPFLLTIYRCVFLVFIVSNLMRSQLSTLSRWWCCEQIVFFFYYYVVAFSDRRCLFAEKKKQKKKCVFIWMLRKEMAIHTINDSVGIKGMLVNVVCASYIWTFISVWIRILPSIAIALKTHVSASWTTTKHSCSLCGYRCVCSLEFSFKCVSYKRCM